MEDSINKIIDEIQKTRNLDFSSYNLTTLKNRILERMKRVNIDSPKEYIAFLRSDKNEFDHLIDTILINVSSFFRDPVVFEIIAQKVIPEIIYNSADLKFGGIRIWSAGCAAGEEAFSIAILVHEAYKDLAVKGTPFIFATDINEKVLKRCSDGEYPRDSLKNIKLGFLDLYFENEKSGTYRVHPFIKDMVRFSINDLTSLKHAAPAESVFGTFDIVLCRNVLIYYSAEVQKQIFAKLDKTIANGGFLVLGTSETLAPSIKSRYAAVDNINKIYKKLR